MGGRKLVDLEAKLFDTEKKGCLGVLVGPRKRGEIDVEVHQDGSSRMKIGLKGLVVPEGTRQVSVYINETAIADLELQRGSAYLRLDSRHGDIVPEVSVKDVATVRVGDRVLCSGSFHRD
jgi:hypothetical protein